MNFKNMKVNPMKMTLTTFTLGAMLLAGTALADHAGDGKPCEMNNGKPCPMMLDKTAKPMAHAMHGMSMEPKGDASASSQAYAQGNMDMHKGMDIVFTGDADIDFLRGMIPHHQGAVDMARVQLKYGSHPQLKRMTREIIRAQELEICQMKSLLKQLEGNKAGLSDSNWMGHHKGDM
ncbi:MAG: DUF305 domain-containing protein [Alphaproteobacteria bacterium]